MRQENVGERQDTRKNNRDERQDAGVATTGDKEDGNDEPQALA